MQTFELFYATLVDEFMVLAKNHGRVFSATYESGNHRDDYQFGLELSVSYNRENPSKKHYTVRNPRGWLVAQTEDTDEVKARCFIGERIVEEFSREKGRYYGSIQ